METSLVNPVPFGNYWNTEYKRTNSLSVYFSQVFEDTITVLLQILLQSVKESSNLIMLWSNNLPLIADLTQAQ